MLRWQQRDSDADLMRSLAQLLASGVPIGAEGNDEVELDRRTQHCASAKTSQQQAARSALAREDPSRADFFGPLISLIDTAAAEFAAIPMR